MAMILQVEGGSCSLKGKRDALYWNHRTSTMRSKVAFALASAIGILLGTPSSGYVALAPCTPRHDGRSHQASPFLVGNGRSDGQERWAHRKGSGGGSEDNEDKDYQDALARNRKRTDVNLFLTQRAIQSFAHLLLETRDPHTVRWIETHYDVPNLNSFHGTSAFNYTQWGEWDSVFRDMLSKPKDVVVVSAKRRGRPNNPYFEDRYIDFEIEIDPVSLVSRMLSVRDQLSKEWTIDLESIATATTAVLPSYYANLASSRQSEECALSSSDVSGVGGGVANADAGSIAGDGGAAGPEGCPDSEHLAAPSPAGDNDLARQRGTFDRTAQLMLSHTMAFHEYASSPLRQRNLDLLQLLATQEAVHRVLRQYREAGDVRHVSLEWLRDLYVSVVGDYFDGNQTPGRGDDFVEHLLTLPPSLKTVDRKVELVDPLRIAEDVLDRRTEMCREWKECLEMAPLEHMELRKLILAYQMGNQPTGPSVFAHVEEGVTSEATLQGEFE